MTSPQRLPADRLLAARASAAAMAGSAIRVGYVAAALARAGKHSGGMSFGSALNSNRDMAAAAVRAAAAHTTVAGPEGGLFASPRTPPRTPPRTSPRMPPTPEDTGAAGSSSEPSPRPSSPSDVPSTPQRWPEAPLRPNSSEVASTAQRWLEVPRSPEVVQTPQRWSEIPPSPNSSEVASTPQRFPEVPEMPVVESAAGPAVDEARSSEMVAVETSNSEQRLATIVVSATTDKREAESSDEESARVWDVVVQKTFISVVPRRQVLPHSASAPGCLVANRVREAGRVLVSRPRRQRSSRRRSRRHRAGGMEQTAAGNTAQVH